MPERIVCSTAVRTRETLDLVCDAADWRELEVDFDEVLYLASESTIIDMVEENLRSYDRLMIVGHNPGLDCVLLTYCPNVPLSNNHKLMTTAAVAVIKFTNSDLRNPQLVEIRRPGEMD